MEPDLQGEASTRLPALASDLVHDIDTSLALYISPGVHLHIIYLLPALLVKQGLTFFWISWREHLTLCKCWSISIPVFCLFHKIIISCITKYMTEPSMEMMTRLEGVDQMYILIYDQ